jgi:uncharacterized protein
MTRPPVPRVLLDPVVKYFKPQSVILFGSRARGEATRDSDIDLLVIVDDDTPPEKLTWKAVFDAHPSFTGAADVFPMRAETFDREKCITGTLAAEADTDGIVVYGLPKGSASMKPVDPCTSWEAVERWLAVAEVDREAIAVCLASPSTLRGIAAFHCQKGIEKLLKGFLVLAGKRFRKTHSLARLGAAVQQSFPDLENLVRAARNWSDWAFEYRYPSASGPAKALPEEDELWRALAAVDILVARLPAARPGD